MNSPFINDISECKKRMRKLRKKIYKHNVTQVQKKSINKNQDISSILIKIFEKRKIPTTIIQSLKSKRNIDIFNLKSLVMGNQHQLKYQMQMLQQKTTIQQEQIKMMYQQHCQRMNQLKKNQLRTNSNRNILSNSSTEDNFSAQSYSNHEGESISLSIQHDIQEISYFNQCKDRIQLERNSAKIFSSFHMEQCNIDHTDNIFEILIN